MSTAFTLIEMIGVLAIIGILASVVAPKVFDAIRDAKITGTVAVNGAVRTATVDYARKYRILPIDGTRGPAGGSFTRPYGDGASITSNNITYGDVLISEGMLERLTVPIGPAGSNALSTNTISIAGTGTNATISTGSLNYPAVVCQNYTATNETTRLFSAAANSVRVVYMVIPGLTIMEAAGVKTKIDGPFDESVRSPYEVVAAAVNRTNSSAAIREAITRGNCLLMSNALGYTAVLYVAHE